ncbi:MAG: hypothetical protein ILNGONEN_00821 [Syntrophorhabdaceae bacterium]|nr:hypothetical protein [Syntrophorhabdaceae bacterium]
MHDQQRRGVWQRLELELGFDDIRQCPFRAGEDFPEIPIFTANQFIQIVAADAAHDLGKTRANF